MIACVRVSVCACVCVSLCECVCVCLCVCGVCVRMCVCVVCVCVCVVYVCLCVCVCVILPRSSRHRRTPKPSLAYFSRSCLTAFPQGHYTGYTEDCSSSGKSCTLLQAAEIHG